MTLSTLSPSEVAYLKMLHRMNERKEITSVSALAKKFHVKLPSAIEILRRLEKKGLVIRRPWEIPELSRKGVTLSEQVMHKHRVLEIYLNTKLGISSDTSCEEASKIDYLVGTDVVEKMCKALNRPSRCLHGLPIQHAD